MSTRVENSASIIEVCASKWKKYAQFCWTE